MANNKQDIVVDEVMDVVDPDKVLANRRKYVKDALKSAEKAAEELEKATATEKVRLQGTKETKAPKLKPYTESLDVKDRFELGRLIEGAKKDNRPWKVKRCSDEKLAEGYRYTFITTKVEDVFTESLNKPTLNEEEEVTVELPPVEAPVELEVSAEETPAEEAPSEEGEPKLGTFEEQMDFLAADEDEAIQGYEMVLDLIEDEHVKAQLEKILIEEKAHKDFLAAVKEDPTLEYSHEEEHEEKEEEEEEVPDEEVVEVEIAEPKQEEEPIEEASSAEKKAFRHGGEDLDDLVTGRALARIKDPHERAMLLHQKRMEKTGKRMSDRPAVSDTLKRKEDQAHVAYEKKAMSMAKAGMEDEPLDEGVKISLDDLNLFKPWGGAKDTWELIVAQDKIEALDKALEDMYPEGITATDLNDILWFEKDWIFDTVGVDPFIKRDDAIEVDAVAKEEPSEEEA